MIHPARDVPRDVPRGAARFVLEDGTPLGTYHLSLPKPMGEVVWFALPIDPIHAHPVLSDEGDVLLVLHSREDFERLREEVNKYDRGAVRGLS